MPEQWGWYLTGPWEPVSIRRGDALGFRGASDYFAELLAPGLSNNTSDARWISLLSWCLKWSHIAWQNAGGRDLSRRDEQRERYTWLRPLELLWVDRTLEAGQKTGQLRGRRSIERWRKNHRSSPNFAMSSDQFRRYRQVGTYGAYRVVLRTMPRLTTGDGWTPDDTSLQLARLVNDSLPGAARLRQEHFENGTQWGHWSKGKQVEYWTKHGWAEWEKSAGRGFLPTPDEAIRRPLPKEERQLLAPALFPVELHSSHHCRRAGKHTLSEVACRSVRRTCPVERDCKETQARKRIAGSAPGFLAFCRCGDVRDARAVGRD